jgi:hypothetical protein
MGGAIAKFTHPFNEPMNRAFSIFNTSLVTDRTSRQTYFYQPSSSESIYSFYLDSGYNPTTDQGRMQGDTIIRPQVGSGPPISGKPSVDGGGNLSFSGSGYTYVIRVPNNGENGFSNGSTGIGIYNLSSMTRLNERYLYGTDSGVPRYSGDYFHDKNNGPAWYVTTSSPLKNGQHLMVIYLKFSGSNEGRFGFTNWYNA